jgi:hypothetical protein
MLTASKQLIMEIPDPNRNLSRMSCQGKKSGWLKTGEKGYVGNISISNYWQCPFFLALMNALKKS